MFLLNFIIEKCNLSKTKLKIDVPKVLSNDGDQVDVINAYFENNDDSKIHFYLLICSLIFF